MAPSFWRGFYGGPLKSQYLILITLKILFFLALWQRPQITDICLAALHRIQQTSKEFEVSVLCVLSEEEMKPLVEKYGFNWVEHENLPVGKKKNFGLHAALSPSVEGVQGAADFDYMIELGSDDLIKPELLQLYAPYFRKGIPYLSLNKLIFLDSYTGHARQYNSTTVFGAGRAMSRAMLADATLRTPCLVKKSMVCSPKAVTGGFAKQGEEIWLHHTHASELVKSNLVEITGAPEHKLWPDHINRCLDNNSDKRLFDCGYEAVVVDSPKPLIIDIKSDENLWNFNPDLGHRISHAQLFEGLTASQIHSLKTLWAEASGQKPKRQEELAA